MPSPERYVRPSDYTIPRSAGEALSRYERGERFMAQSVLDEADFTQKTLQGVNFMEVMLREAECAECIFTAVDFSLGDLRLSIFNRADLSDALFSLARLQGTSFVGTRLCGAVFTNANLSQANLTGADLTGASLHGAILTGVDLTGATLLGVDLGGATFDESTLWPHNLDPLMRGARKHHSAPA